MAGNSLQKHKLIRLLMIFYEYTDKENGITLQEISSRLDDYGISAERKSLYSDIEILKELGFEIKVVKHARETKYHLEDRIFDLAELKLLVDAVATSKLITGKQSIELIKKIERLGSRRQALELKRNLVFLDRPKSKNESAFKNIDIISKSQKEGMLIDFEYCRLNKDKQLVLRTNGIKKDVCPIALEFCDGNYYMIAYDLGAKMIKHYRLDKMKNIRLSKNKIPSKGIPKPKFPEYSVQMSGMFSGYEETIRLEVLEENIGIVIDKFGSEAVNIIPISTACNTCICRITVQVSNLLYGWLLGVSDKVKLLGPEKVLNSYEELLRQNLSSISSSK